MIRLAKPSDKGALAYACKKFLEETNYPFALDTKKLFDSFDEAIINPELLALVYQEENKIVGFLFAGIASPPFSSTRVAAEMAWFVLPEYRGTKNSFRLLHAFEYWGEKEKCDFLVLNDVHTLNDLGTLYTRMGYTLTEKTYVKEVK